MKRLLVVPAAAMLLLGTVAPMPGHAADASHPHRNVNKSNDMGNSTGDAAVEKLNADELAKIQGGQATAGVPPTPAAATTMPAKPMAHPRPMHRSHTAGSSMATPASSMPGTPPKAGSSAATTATNGGGAAGAGTAAGTQSSK